MGLYQRVREAGCRRVAVVGLAKNTGKTVAMNTLAAEAVDAGRSLLLSSFGRDGEYRDGITRERKPAIFIPPGNCYATVETLAGPHRQRRKLADLSFSTPLGGAGLFRAGDAGVRAELAGLNTVSRQKELIEAAAGLHNLFLLDGALDRMAAAVPELVDGVVLATGAALEGDEASVAGQTARVIDRLSLPVCDTDLPEPVGGAVIIREETAETLPEASWFAGELPPGFEGPRHGDRLVLPGSLGDALAEVLLSRRDAKDFEVVVKDGTRVFLSDQAAGHFKDRGIRISVRTSLPVVAVTANPHSPSGAHLDPSRLRRALEKVLVGYPVYDVLSKDYIHNHCKEP